MIKCNIIKPNCENNNTRDCERQNCTSAITSHGTVNQKTKRKKSDTVAVLSTGSSVSLNATRKTPISSFPSWLINICSWPFPTNRCNFILRVKVTKLCIRADWLLISGLKEREASAKGWPSPGSVEYEEQKLDSLQFGHHLYFQFNEWGGQGWMKYLKQKH